MNSAFIKSAVMLNNAGMISLDKDIIPWDDNQFNDPRKISRKQVYNKIFTRFGKLNVPDRLAFSTAALLLSNFEEEDKAKYGICIATRFGSLSTDLRFLESIAKGFPRPGYFSATLPSSPVAEIAITFKIKGPDRVICGNNSGFTALSAALRLIKSKKATSVIMIFVCGIDEEDNSYGEISALSTQPFAAGFLLTNENYINSSWKINLKKMTISSHNSPPVSEESYFSEIFSSLKNNLPSQWYLPSVNSMCSLELVKD